MAGNIRVVNYRPRLNPTAQDQVDIAFLFPVDTPVSLTDAVAAQPSIGKGVKVGVVSPVDAAWQAPTNVVTYSPNGSTGPGTVAQVPATIAAVLDATDKAAIQAGTVVAPVTVTLPLTGTIDAFLAGTGNDYLTANLMWNQSHQDFQRRYAAQRKAVGARLDEQMITDLANVPANLQPKG